MKCLKSTGVQFVPWLKWRLLILRDHMNDLELIFSMLGEASTTAIVKTKNPKGFVQNKIVAKEGGTIAGDARKALELKSGEKVVSQENYLPVEKKKKELKKAKKKK